MLAIRRNIANTSCASMGAALLEDLSKDTVARAEIRCQASLVMCMREFHAGMENRVAENAAPSSPGVVSHSFCSDATNSAIWQSAKLQGAELLSSYVMDPLAAASD